MKKKSDEENFSSRYRTESITVTTERLTQDQLKDDREEMSSEDNVLLTELFIQLNMRPHEIKSENDSYFAQLNALRRKYPKNPSILNHLGPYYAHLGNDEKVEQIIIETYEKFPNYLFALTGIANLHVKNKKPEKFLETYGGKYTLKQLYPEREVFHLDEVRGFHHSFFQYYCAVGNMEKAKSQIDILTNITTQLDREDDPILHDMILHYEKYEAFDKLRRSLKVISAH